MNGFTILALCSAISSDAENFCLPVHATLASLGGVLQIRADNLKAFLYAFLMLDGNLCFCKIVIELKHKR